MSVDPQRASGMGRKGAEAGTDRQRGIAPARNVVKSCDSYRSPDHLTAATSQVAGQSCEGCYKRSGKLTHQFAHGPCGRYGEVPRFVFRSYHCRWCLASANRRKKREGKPLWRYLEWSPDSEILSPNAGNERR